MRFLAPVRSGRMSRRGEAMRRGGAWLLRAEARDAGGMLVAFATPTWKLPKTSAAPGVAAQQAGLASVTETWETWAETTFQPTSGERTEVWLCRTGAAYRGGACRTPGPRWRCRAPAAW